MSTTLVTFKKIASSFICNVIIASAVIVFIFPTLSLAQGSTGGGTGTGGGSVGGNTGQTSVQKVKLENPLNVNSIEDLIGGILNVVLILAVPVIVFFIIYAGFLYATARGNAEQVKKATTALTYAIIGGVLIIGSVAIAEIVKELVSSFQSA